MNLADLRADLADVLGTVADLHVYPEVPDTVNLPAGIVTLDAGQRVDFQSGQAVTTHLILLESRADSPRGQARLDALLASVLDAVDDTSSSVAWTGWEGYGATYTVNTVEYVGVQINVVVYG